MLVDKYYVKDIKEFEELTGKSVISILKEQDFDGLVDLFFLLALHLRDGDAANLLI